MKGLLMKDMKLMKMQKNFFMIIAAISIGMAVFGETESFSSFIVVYVTFIGALFTLSTISYDEFDNGNAFLFSLPVTRREYVAEKYGFGVIAGLLFWVLGLMIDTVVGYVKGTFTADVIMMALMLLPFMFIMLGVTLPFHLKFGGEKGRIAILIAVGLMFLVCTLAGKIVHEVNFDVISLIDDFEAVGFGVLIVVAAAVFFVSYKISVSIMNAKEF